MRFQSVAFLTDEEGRSVDLKNDKIHAMFMGLGGGYLLYLAYQLLDKFRTGTGEMPDAVFILAITVFAAGGIGILIFALMLYRKSDRDNDQEKD